MPDVLTAALREIADLLTKKGFEFHPQEQSQVETRLRQIFGGDRCYIGKTSADAIRHQSNRDRAILRDWRHGEHIPVLARRYGLSPRRVQQLVAGEITCLNDFAAVEQSPEHDRVHDRTAPRKAARRG